MPGNNRAVFLDRDGTMVADPGYLNSPDQLELLPGAADAIAKLRGNGFAVVLATNQSAIARGLLTVERLEAIHERLGQMLAEANPDAKLDGIYFCPFHPEAVVSAYRQESYLRKPRPGMLFKAAREFQLDLGSCWMVGDSERDVQAGKSAGCRTVRINADPETDTAADRVCPTLAEAADFILASPGRTPLKTPRSAAEAAAITAVPAAAPIEVATAVAAEAAHGRSGAAEDAAAEVLTNAAAPLREMQAAPLPPVPAPQADDDASSAQAEPSRDGPASAVSAARTGRTLGETKRRLLEELEAERGTGRRLTEPQPDHEDAPAPPADPPAVEQPPAGPAKPAQPVDAASLRHLLAELLQQLRQMNRPPEKRQISTTKIIGGMVQGLSYAGLAVAVFFYFANRQWDAIITGMIALFLQVSSVAWLMMQKDETE